MKRLLALLGVVVLTLPVFASCGLDEQGTLSADGGGGKPGDASTVDAQGCWTEQKVCDGVCTSTKLVEKGCAGTGCIPCALPHATAKCSESDGLCAVDTCEPGWENCDKNTTLGNATGCEAQIAVDPKACGASCTDCTKNGSNWSCCNGKCVRDDCIASGQLNCDCAGECDVPIDDINNCGFCNHKCEFANATALCVKSNDPLKATNGYACEFQCTYPWADCDKQEANGCEVDLFSDTAHCGSCPKVCNGNHGTPGCSAGKCVIICDAGWGDCDSNADNGCETPLNQMGICGGCGVVCAPQHASGATCASGSCTYGSCNAGWGDCNNNKADGCETSLATLTNCGSCGQACAPQHATGVTCWTGTCNFTGCAAGWGDCNNNKADGCETPTTTTTDCGSCGQACNPPNATGATCSTGSCTYGACDPGYGDCNPSKADGCETSLTTLTNCGSCGKACAPPHATGVTCATGTCDFTGCAAGWDNCDGDKTNGCETQLGTDQNCSKCGDDCTGGQKCCPDKTCKGSCP